MYEKCGVKPPARGSLAKKMFVGAIQRSLRPSRVTKEMARDKIRKWTGVKEPVEADDYQLEHDYMEDEVEQNVPDTNEFDEQAEAYAELTRDVRDEDVEDPIVLTKDPESCHCNDVEAKGDQERIDEHLIAQDGIDDYEIDELSPVHSSVINSNALNKYNMSLEQRRDPNLVEVISWVIRKSKPSWLQCVNQDQKEYYRKFDKLYLDNDTLYVLEDQQRKLCIPKHLVVEFITVLHRHPFCLLYTSPSPRDA